MEIIEEGALKPEAEVGSGAIAKFSSIVDR
jgi:hypothetical protein